MLKVNRRLIFLFLLGLMFGGAGLIPGFSSGTIAYLFGVYPVLIGTYASLLKSPKQLSTWVDVGVLLVAMGMGAYLTSIVVNFVYTAFYYQVMWVFIGFVIASIFPLLDKIKRISSNKNLVFSFVSVLPIILGVFLIYEFRSQTLIPTHGFLSVGIFFVSAMLAALGGLLPGVSGSVVWMALGQYPRFLFAINRIVFADIAIFIVGSLVGYVFFSSLIEKVLDKYPLISYTLLTGLTLASSLWLIEYQSNWTLLDWMTQAIVPLIIGFVVVMLVYKYYMVKKEG